MGSLRFEYETEDNSWKKTVEEAVRRGADLSDADLSDVNLSDADLSGADLSGAEFYKALFYGRGGHRKLKKEQVTDFLAALGFEAEGQDAEPAQDQEEPKKEPEDIRIEELTVNGKKYRLVD